MSDPLALARATPLGPHVPATEAMLTGWCGPCEVRGLSATVCYATEDRYRVDVHVRRSCLVRLSDIRLDCRRPEVRWRLVDLGLLPVALRDHPGAAVAAGMGVAVRGAMPALRNGSPEHYLSLLVQSLVLDVSDGYLIPLPGGGVGFVSKESP